MREAQYIGGHPTTYSGALHCGTVQPLLPINHDAPPTVLLKVLQFTHFFTNLPLLLHESSNLKRFLAVY